jgi:uncharacterized repeat protein (TIGR03803 family)
VQGSDGNFYGTSTQNNNLIFKLTPTGILSVIFHPPTSGPNANLIFNGALLQLSDGNFYGTASSGGAHGPGAIFKVTPAFSGETSAGLYQLNLTIPQGLGAGDVPLQAIVGGIQTPTGPVISLQ